MRERGGVRDRESKRKERREVFSLRDVALSSEAEVDEWL